MRMPKFGAGAILLPLLLTLLTAMLGAPPPQPAVAAAPAATSNPPFFVHYYLWWTNLHWHDKLGPAYPYTAQPLPLPATLAADTCRATSPYPGNQLIDLPQAGLATQDDPATFDRNIQQAADAGIRGFVVSWSGNGQAGQTPAGYSFNRRLDSLVSRVAAYNATHTNRFYLLLGYEGLDGSRNPRPTSWVQNDWAYFAGRYLTNPVFQVPNYGNKPVVMFLQSRSFSVAAIAAIVRPYMSRMVIVGDEHGPTNWNRGVAPYFAGDGWYWSSQDPYRNPASFTQLANFAALLRSQGKLWFAPMNGGYNRSNFGLGSTCVPRNNGQTMQAVYNGNKASQPNGWMYISWNEYVENTYLEPSRRYGSQYLNLLQNIIAHP